MPRWQGIRSVRFRRPRAMTPVTPSFRSLSATPSTPAPVARRPSNVSQATPIRGVPESECPTYRSQPGPSLYCAPYSLGVPSRRIALRCLNAGAVHATSATTGWGANVTSAETCGSCTFSLEPSQRMESWQSLPFSTGRVWPLEWQGHRYYCLLQVVRMFCSCVEQPTAHHGPIPRYGK